ncbi:hypothetical protein Scep_014411 [Stephania cephalantha]|uniref:Uncharacterized protein n=1 Tax=Stephania cephalantha TaxID=152367 RepID=A0AAP0J2J1_9MAGN
MGSTAMKNARDRTRGWEDQNSQVENSGPQPRTEERVGTFDMVGGVERGDKGVVAVLGGGGGGVRVKVAAVGDGEALRAWAIRLMSIQDLAVLGPSDPEANDMRLSGLDPLQVGSKPFDYSSLESRPEKISKRATVATGCSTAVESLKSYEESRHMTDAHSEDSVSYKSHERDSNAQLATLIHKASNPCKSPCFSPLFFANFLAGVAPLSAVDTSSKQRHLAEDDVATTFAIPDVAVVRATVLESRQGGPAVVAAVVVIRIPPPHIRLALCVPCE